MSYQVLARKYRPQRFSDVVGQNHVTRTLLNALAQDRIAHGYIFSGHRGIGKTTIARILAMALNCRTEIGSEKRPTPEPCEVCDSCTEIKAGNAVDVIEIDAATNRGIDEIRELRDAARYAPSRDRYKIYILDEAHQITDAAFNALLKTLEEPPPHIIFMMATTQPEDIPQTIRSRCQHFSFHAVKLDDIVGQLRRIATAEHILADDATLSLLAEAGDGSMRDALSIMDQAIASAPVVSAAELPGAANAKEPGASTLEPGAPFMTASSSWVGSANAKEPGASTLEPGAPFMTASSSWVGNDDATEPSTPTKSPGAPFMTASSSWVGSANAKEPGASTLEPGAPFMTASSSWVGSGPGQRAGYPHLEITQVRELMGSVSNVVYEQLLEAVHANNSADVLAITGRLLDAGNGAPQLARQFVRYLRNTIVAKITGLSADAEATGIAADLLQISPEERSRAARSAALFTEEELARFLSIVLRTFDDLGYRQEQRFHLELGLLKLVHMQRLVPIEDLLSQLGAKPASTPNSTATTPGAPNPATTPGAPSSATAPSSPKVGSATRNPGGPPFAASSQRVGSGPRTPTPPPPSPFESDHTRKTPTASSSAATATTSTEGSLALAGRHTQASEAASGPQLVATPQPTTLSSQPEPAPQPTTLSSRQECGVPGERSSSLGCESSQPHRKDAAERPAVPPGGEAFTPDLAALQSILAAALAAAKGQQSASEQIEDATLTLTGDTLTLQTTLSKTMLPVILNAEAERILKLTLREQNLSALKLKLLPGSAAAASPASTAPRKTRSAATGSAAELAEKHPIVQQAKRLFSADISNVIDLRKKD